MTTTDIAPVVDERISSTLWERTSRVARLLLANPWVPVFTPAMILGFVFVVNYAIWLLVARNTAEGDLAQMNNGGVFFVMVYILVIAVQTINATFPFAMGFGVTRRDFYLGSSMFFFALAAVNSAGLTAMAAIEKATDGWGLKAQFFVPDFAGEVSLGETFFAFFVLLLLFVFIGMSTASVYVRWRANGMYVFFASLVVLLVALGWGLTEFDGWEPVGQFFADAGVVGTIAWTLVPTAIAAVGGYLLLRRATPRS